jgi:hypothetical protein
MYRANLDGSMIASLGSGVQLNGLAVVHPGPEISVTHRTGLVTKENGGSPLYRGLASIAFIASGRLMVMRATGPVRS